MADIAKTVDGESIASCTLPEGALVMAEEPLPTVTKIKLAMAALRDKANKMDVHRVANMTGVKWTHVRDIRDAMRAKVAGTLTPETIEEK